MPKEIIFRHQFPITIRWGDMDAYQHVNNTLFFRYLESARFAYFEQYVLPLIDGKIPMIVLAEMQCKFEAEIVYPAELVVKSKISRLGRSSFDVYAEIWNAGKRCAQSTAVMVWLNPESKRPEAVPEIVAQAIRTLEHLA